MVQLMLELWVFLEPIKWTVEFASEFMEEHHCSLHTHTPLPQAEQFCILDFRGDFSSPLASTSLCDYRSKSPSPHILLLIKTLRK